MKNTFLVPRVQRDIDIRVNKILRELGNPPPPLRPEDVFELLRLDKSYFANSDDSIMRRTIHRLKVAGKQVLARPALLGEALRKLELKALYMLDGRRVLIDETVPKLKHRWLEAHEVIHDILEWHREAMLGDNEHTVKPACHAKIEVEANYGAGQLLFFGARFVEEARSSSPSFASLDDLHGVYGNTMTTTLWRYVELAWPELPMVGIISVHPHPDRRPAGFDPHEPCKHFIQSPAFATQFCNVSEIEMFAKVTDYCGRQRGGPLGDCEMEIEDTNGDTHLFFFETFFNRHDALTLGRWLRKAPIAVAV